MFSEDEFVCEANRRGLGCPTRAASRKYHLHILRTAKSDFVAATCHFVAAKSGVTAAKSNFVVALAANSDFVAAKSNFVVAK